MFKSLLEHFFREIFIDLEMISNDKAPKNLIRFD